MNLSLSLMFACLATTAQAQGEFDDQRQAYSNLKAEIERTWSDQSLLQEKNWNQYRDQITKKWSDGIMPAVKTNVIYSADKKSRVRLDYQQGEVYLELLSDKKIEHSEASLKLKNILIQNNKLISDQLPSGTAASTKSLGKLIENEGIVHGNDGQDRQLYRIQIPMVKNHVKIRAKKYLPIVLNLAVKFSLPPALILAIIWQESSFNPVARSYIPAFGLMQIVPKYAGEEVRSALGESIVVDENFLYDAGNNIRYGAHYLKLLSENHFAQILNFESRAPFIIAAYNWGPTRLKQKIKQGQFQFTTARSLKEQIIKIAPAETKDYLSKVISHWKQIENENWFDIPKLSYSNTQ